MLNRNSTLLQQPTEMPHKTNPNEQSFVAPGVRAIPVDAANLFFLVIHSDKRLTDEHIRRYNGPQTSEVAAIVSGVEDGTVGRQDIHIR